MSESPPNALEAALAAAARDPRQRPKLLRVLRNSRVTVIDESPELGDGNASKGVVANSLAGRDRLRLRNLEIDGRPHVPVFSRPERIRQVRPDEVAYLELAARDLLAIVQRAHLVLDPGSDHSARLSPQEVASLLDGPLRAPVSVQPPPAAAPRPEPVPLQLGPLPEPPEHLVDALVHFFRTRKQVRAAYLGQRFDPEGQRPSRILLGIEVRGSWEWILSEVTVVLRTVTRPDEKIDCMAIDGSKPARFLVEETEPFYRKKRFGLF